MNSTLIALAWRGIPTPPVPAPAGHTEPLSRYSRAAQLGGGRCAPTGWWSAGERGVPLHGVCSRAARCTLERAALRLSASCAVSWMVVRRCL